jgi:hypothetical protein
MAKTHKRTEALVAEYLGCPRDEHGSRRAWKDLHDLRVEGLRDCTFIIEVKSHEWRSGPGSLWTLLDEALDQCVSAMEREGLSEEDWCYPVAVYWPTRCPHDGSAIAYLQVDGQRVAMPLREFRARYISEREDAE